MQQSPQKEKFINARRDQRKGTEGKAKFQKERQDRAVNTPLLPMNEKQKRYIQALEEGVSVILATGHAGCVDKDTEFLSQDGWKKISEYQEGDLVTQYCGMTNALSLVTPVEYIKQPFTDFAYQFETLYELDDLTKVVALDMVLTPEHNVAHLKRFPIVGQSPVDKISTLDFIKGLEEGEQYTIRSNDKSSLIVYKKNTTISKVKMEDGFKYCFEVPTGFLYLRRNGVTFITGNSSKTYIPTKFACLEFLSDRVYKIAFSRPAISNSRSLGYFGGSKDEKMEVWLAPVLSTVKQVLGSEETNIAVKREDLMFYPLEIIKGLSLGSNDANRRMYFIVDEAEDLSIDEVKKIVTRIGKNCTLVLAGDVTQSELKESSGLKWLINFVERHNMKDFVHIDFNDVNDIVRSNTVKTFITCLERDKKAGIEL